MKKKSDITKEKISITENANPPSDMIKEAFFQWLSDGHAQKYPASEYLSCIDKVSVYLTRRKITPMNLWKYTKYEVFKSIYDQAINDKIFRITDRKTYVTFIEVGQVFLKFLKSKPVLDKVPAIAAESLNSRLTIRESIIRVLQNERHGMTIEQIYNKIIEDGLYSFGARNPRKVVRVEIDRACVDSNYTIRASKDYFRFERNKKGEKVYFLLPSTLTDETIQPRINASGESKRSEQANNKTNRLEVWNDSIIRHKFQIWMECGNHSSATIRNYSSALGRTFRTFKSILENAVNESSTEQEAAYKFVELLYKDSGFNSANNAAHNQLSAALNAFTRFIDRDMRDDPTVNKDAHSELDDIIDLEEGKKCLREILETHFLTLYGYSNIGIVWSAAQNSMSMFLNDNAINSDDDLWRFLVRAFKNDFIFSSPHIWHNPPDYPQSSKGLVINLARHNGGVVTREQIDNYFTKIKLTSLTNSFVLDKEQLLFYDKSKFILTETVNPNTDCCSQIAKALNTLFSSENTQYIVLRDIKSEWFSGLPGLNNGLPWTPLLLQELLRICPNIGYKVILPSLQRQALDTIGAAIVPVKKEIETFADVVHLFCLKEYKLPHKLSAEELRLKLREVGMIEGNELIYNMHKALRDYRFAFSDENRTLMILER